MKSYSWVITRDYLNKVTRTVAIGPRGCKLTAKEIRAAGDEFRLLDADRITYFTGYISGDYAGFEPLDDYGAGDSGCTIIQYRDGAGEWRDL